MATSPLEEKTGLEAEMREDDGQTGRHREGDTSLTAEDPMRGPTRSTQQLEDGSLAALDWSGGPPQGSWELEADRLLDEIASQLPLPGGGHETSDSDSSVSWDPITPARAAVLEARLQGAVDRSRLAQLTLVLACGYARVAALFVVNRGLVAGLRGRGDDLGRRVEGIMVPVGTGKLFSHPVLTLEPYRTGVPEDEVDSQLLRALGRLDAQHRGVFPIVVRGRAVNLLYADNGPDAMAETSAAALRALCRCVAETYERLILKRVQPASVPD